jgi:hypothetical protein
LPSSNGGCERYWRGGGRFPFVGGKPWRPGDSALTRLARSAAELRRREGLGRKVRCTVRRCHLPRDHGGRVARPAFLKLKSTGALRASVKAGIASILRRVLRNCRGADVPAPITLRLASARKRSCQRSWLNVKSSAPSHLPNAVAGGGAPSPPPRCHSAGSG